MRWLMKLLVFYNIILTILLIVMRGGCKLCWLSCHLPPIKLLFIVPYLRKSNPHVQGSCYCTWQICKLRIFINKILTNINAWCFFTLAPTVNRWYYFSLHPHFTQYSEMQVFEKCSQTGCILGCCLEYDAETHYEHATAIFCRSRHWWERSLAIEQLQWYAVRIVSFWL